jgi:hypothetical protein
MKALNSENARRYLRYAVGELILIVFGILLALQINEWNEERSNRKKLQGYYTRLLTDLKSNLEDYNLLIRINQARLDSVPVFLNLLYQKKTLAQVNLLVKMHIFNPRNTTPTKTTYEELKNTGNFNLIQNTRIKERLDLYYKDQQAKLETLDKLNDRLQETPALVVLRQQLNNYFDLIYVQRQQVIDWQWLNQPQEARFKDVQAQLLLIADIRRTQIHLLATLRANAQKTIAIIESSDDQE